MSKVENVVIINFGGQYTQLIARRVRECHVALKDDSWARDYYVAN